MGRAWRIEYEGALYHLMSPGNDGQHIYLNDADRNLFLQTISEMSERFKVDIFAYVLMTNEKLRRLFNMSYSAISHCVKIFKEKMNKDKKVKSQFEEINSQFKLLTPNSFRTIAKRYKQKLCLYNANRKEKKEMSTFNSTNPIFRIWNVLVCLVVIAFPLVAKSSIVQWDTASGGNNHLYDVILVGTPLSWNDARSAAQAKGSNWDLVTITSSAENDFVKDLFADDPSFFNTVASGSNRSGPWIGAYNVSGSTNFQWVTGEPVTFTNWGPSEPFGNGQSVSCADFSSPYGDGIGIAWNDIGPDFRSDGPIAYIIETVNPVPDGDMVTHNLWIQAVINTVEKGPIDAVWQKGGEDTTSRGDRVIWGHFYASPNDVTWGSENNPDLFVKIWFDVSGRVDVNFFHVSVPDIEVYSDYPYDGTVDEYGTTTMSRRYIRQYYQNGESYMDENYEDGEPPSGYSPTGNPFGYPTINDLRIGSIINTVEKGPVDAMWRLGGQDTTSRGDQVVWGLFYACPSDVTWGSENNPDLFVKIWFDVSGRVDVNFFHVSVPDIEVYSDLPDDSNYDQKGTTIMDNRYIRHEYWR